MTSTIFFLICVCLAVDAGVLTLKTWNTNTQCQTTPDTSVTTALGSCFTFPQALNGTQSAWSDCSEVDGTMTTKVCTDTNCQVGCVTTTVSLSLIACECSGSICVSTSCGATPAIPPRSIVSANIGGWYYLVSSKLSSLAGLSNYNVVGDVIVAAIGSVAGNPVKLLAYVKGNVAADTYQGKLASVQVDAAGGTLIEALRYMGEYCETNDKSGYQFGEDRLIQVWPASFGAPWLTTGGSYLDANKKTVYYSSIVSAIRFNGVPVINHTCYVFPYPSVISGRVVSQYSTKCDLIADYGALWSMNASSVQGCPDNKRFIGIAVDYAAASFDIDIQAKESQLNSGQEAKITFASGKLTATWDNYVYAGANINAIVMSKKVPVYGTFLQNVDVTEQVGVNASLNFAVKRMYFTFGSKTDGNTFYWDPTVEVSDPAVCQTCGNVSPPTDYDWIAAVVIVPFLVIVVIAGVAIYFLKFKKPSETA